MYHTGSSYAPHRCCDLRARKRVSQSFLNRRCERMCATEHASRGPSSLLERRHSLAEIVARRAGTAERVRESPPHPEREFVTLSKNASRHGLRSAQQRLRVIDVFDGNGAPSGPNFTLFSWADRPADALRDRSEVGWSPTPHAPVLGALQRALDRNLWQIMVQSNRAQRTLLICMHRWKPPRVRYRRLRTSATDQKRPPGDLRAANRQVSIDAPAKAPSSVSRHPEFKFFGPQYVSYWSL